MKVGPEKRPCFTVTLPDIQMNLRASRATHPQVAKAARRRVPGTRQAAARRLSRPPEPFQEADISASITLSYHRSQ